MSGESPVVDPREVMCGNCPFDSTGPGAALRRALRPGRFEEIAQGIWMGLPFYCHKTTSDEGFEGAEDDYVPNGKERHCGGALVFVRRAQENCERAALRSERRTTAPRDPCGAGPDGRARRLE